MSQSDRIVFVVPYKFVPPINGGHKAAYGFAEYLAKKSDLTVVSTQNNEDSTLPFPLLKLLGNGISRYIGLGTAVSCYRTFRKLKVQKCITHQPFIGLILLPVLKLLGIDFEIFVQNIEYQRFRTMGKKWWPIVFLLEWFLFKMADRLLFISPDDKNASLDIFKLSQEKCVVVPYGTTRKSPPVDNHESRKIIIEKHGFGLDDFLIIFFGPLSYSPNLKAVELIIKEINPILQKRADFNYKFLICGGGLPSEYDGLKQYKEKNIEYLGFVQDIDLYVKASDVMINPVNTGGGVKTKIIESIALGKTVVSSKTGAKGVDVSASGEKLVPVADVDFDAYVAALIAAKKIGETETPSAFYETYFWGNIVEVV